MNGFRPQDQENTGEQRERAAERARREYADRLEAERAHEERSARARRADATSELLAILRRAPIPPAPEA